MIALIVIGVCLAAASVAAVFGAETVANEHAARTNDQRGWWPGSPRRR